MGVDGFSMASLGMPKDITSAQAAVTTEQGVLSGNEKIVGKIDRALNKRINNDEKEENQKNKYFNDGFNEEDDDEDENDENSSVDKDEKISLKTAKQLKTTVIKDPENIVIKVNNATEKIELYNKVTKKIVESITANDFLEMINRLDYNAGVLVNKSI
ncbi:hypothetical protein IJ843_02220 [bacterium]|nr:hypothetical protein [bacterium]